jgi:NAD(P)H-dependent flavin oxidoreductase YrpB (nitropropane dioxygenase family)
MTHPALRTRLCEKLGIAAPIVQTGMGWVAGANLTAATANAGGLGILASATLDFKELADAIAKLKSRTDRPFGVNMRGDTPDGIARVDLMIKEGVRVASFAAAPNEKLIKKCKDAGLFVMPSIGAKRHAEKVQAWGVDAVLIQGAEAGGHVGQVPTTVLLPQIVDAVDIPVIAAGGFFDGRGLVAALAYGASGIAMGTRFLMTSDSRVPDSVKQLYLKADVNSTVVSTKVDGHPHRVLRTPFIDQLERTPTLLALPRALANALRFQRLSGTPWLDLLRTALAIRREEGLSWPQVLQSANTPMLLRRTMIEGNTDAGVAASGVVSGILSDLPSCKELIDRILREAEETLNRLATGAPR